MRIEEKFGVKIFTARARSSSTRTEGKKDAPATRILYWKGGISVQKVKLFFYYFFTFSLAFTVAGTERFKMGQDRRMGWTIEGGKNG